TRPRTRGDRGRVRRSVADRAGPGFRNGRRGLVRRRPDTALANATVYLEAVGHVVVAWVWLEQLVAAHGRKGAFYEGKRAAAAYFFRHELPRTGPQFDLVASRDTTVLHTPTDIL